MASLPYPRRHQIIFPQKPTQPNHLWASAKSVGGSSTPKASVCSVNSVGGSSLPEASVNSVGEPYAAKPSVGICEICGRLFYARSFCEFRGFCGMIAMLVHECSVGAAETAAPPGRAAWVWQGCHTLLQKLPQIALPRYTNNIATQQQQYCHATTTRLPRYNNKIATLR